MRRGFTLVELTIVVIFDCNTGSTGFTSVYENEGKRKDGCSKG